jgi:hypothetical protein
MDKRLELNEKQAELVKRYSELCSEMMEANIKAVYRVDELYFVNGDKVDELNFVDYIDDDDQGDIVEINFNDLECYSYPYDFAVAMRDEQSFAALLKK